MLLPWRRIVIDIAQLVKSMRNSIKNNASKVGRLPKTSWRERVDDFRRWSSGATALQCLAKTDSPALLDLASFHRNRGRRTGIGAFDVVIFTFVSHRLSLPFQISQLHKTEMEKAMMMITTTSLLETHAVEVP
jgi:hypothetical protein